MKSKHISLYKSAIGCNIEDLARRLSLLTGKISRKFDVKYRVKNRETLGKKMILKNTSSVFEINDVYGLKVIVSSVEECYEVLGTVQIFFQCRLSHDYIANPKIRPDKPHLAGKSLRLIKIVAYKNNVPFEIQITTFEFDEMNESLHNEYHREKYFSPRPVLS